MDDRERWRRLTAAAGSLDSPNDLRIYVELLKRADDAGEWCGTFADLGDTLGLSWSSVARTFGRLTAGGWVVKVRDLSRASVWRLPRRGDMASLTDHTGPGGDGGGAGDISSGRDVSGMPAHSGYVIPPTPPRENVSHYPPPPPRRSPESVSLTGGGGDVAGMIYQTGNSCYVKHDTDQDGRPEGVSANGSADSDVLVRYAKPRRADEPEPADLAARLALLGAVTDAGTREQLARRWPVEIIRCGVELASKAKNARDTGAVLVGILRRGVAAAEWKRRSDRGAEVAARTGRDHASRVEAARAVAADAEREQLEREAARARFGRARVEHLREALAVALAELEASKGRAAVRAALHGFNLKAGGALAAVCLRSQVRAAVLNHLDLIDSELPRVVPAAAERFLTEFAT